MTAEDARLITLDEVASAGRTALYRLYGLSEDLLYIGISDDPIERMKQHAREQPWWDEVVRKTAVWYQHRDQAERAETIAIGLEQPRHNKAKRYVRLPEQAFPASPQRLALAPPPAVPAPPPSTEPRGGKIWTWQRNGREDSGELWLCPELNGESMVDDYYEEDGDEQLRRYAKYLERNHPEYLTNDAVQIDWYIRGCRRQFGGNRSMGDIIESAPFQHQSSHRMTEYADLPNFLTYYSWPRDAVTGEPLDWFGLEVRHDRFPELAAAIGWVPSPLQPTCPLRSILASKRLGW